MKYIIDLPEELAKASEEYWEKSTGMVLVPYIETDRKVIEDEVWKFAKKVRLKEFFDDNHNLHPYLDYFDSYQDAKAKHEELKKQKEEIRVGDEVISLDVQYDTMVVTKLWISEYCDEWVDTIAGNGKTYSFLKTSITKTGRHFDEVEELLKKMKEKIE